MYASATLVQWLAINFNPAQADFVQQRVAVQDEALTDKTKKY